MSSTIAYPPEPRSDSAVPFDGDKTVNVRWKTIGWGAGVVAVAALSWGAIKWDNVTMKKDIADHGDKLKEITSHLAIIESDARTTRDSIFEVKYEQKMAGQRLDALTATTNLKLDALTATINMKLDYLTGDKRGPRPATTP